MPETSADHEGENFVGPDESQRVHNPEVAEAMARAKKPYVDVAEKIISGKIHSDSPDEDVLRKIRSGEIAGLIAGKLEELKDLPRAELNALKLGIQDDYRRGISDYNAGLKSEGTITQLREWSVTLQAIHKLQYPQESEE